MKRHFNPSNRYNNRNQYNDKKRDFGPDRNFYIKAPSVLVIGIDGENLGVMNTRDAIALAQENDSDLILISPQATPPVARIMDYSKYLYIQKRKKKQAASNKTKDLKEFRLSLLTGNNDIDIKIGRGIDYLGKGHSVRFFIDVKKKRVSRNMRENMSYAKPIFDRILTKLEGYSTIEPEPTINGNKIFLTFKPNGKTKNKKDSGKKDEHQQA